MYLFLCYNTLSKFYLGGYWITKFTWNNKKCMWNKIPQQQQSQKLANLSKSYISTLPDPSEMWSQWKQSRRIDRWMNRQTTDKAIPMLRFASATKRGKVVSCKNTKKSSRESRNQLSISSAVFYVYFKKPSNAIIFLAVIHRLWNRVSLSTVKKFRDFL